MRTLTLVAALFVALSLAPHAADSAPADTADMQQVLNRLQGTSGLHGAGQAEMAMFLSMVQTPELAAIVGRINQELLAQGGGEGMDLEQVAAFVRQNLTRQDAEQLLGTAVGSREFQQALQTGTDSDSLDSMVQMLQIK